LLQVIFWESFVVIHELDEFAFGDFDAIISEVGGIVVWFEVGIEIGDEFKISRIGIVCNEMFINDKNHLEVLEGLRFETFHDIVHILISPGRDDYG
jgi:hypothetical protein